MYFDIAIKDTNTCSRCKKTIQKDCIQVHLSPKWDPHIQHLDCYIETKLPDRLYNIRDHTIYTWPFEPSLFENRILLSTLCPKYFAPYRLNRLPDHILKQHFELYYPNSHPMVQTHTQWCVKNLVKICLIDSAFYMMFIPHFAKHHTATLIPTDIYKMIWQYCHKPNHWMQYFPMTDTWIVREI